MTLDLLPVATLVLGSTMTFLGGLASESHHTRLTQRQKLEDRHRQAALERDAFQRETLLRLQEAGSALLEAADVVYDEKVRMYEAKDGWPEEKEVSDDVRRARRIARHQAEVLVTRITDKMLRRAVREALSCEAALSHSDTAEEAAKSLTVMRQRFVTANDLLGKSLRAFL